MLLYWFLCNLYKCTPEKILVDFSIWFILTVIYNIIVEIGYFIESGDFKTYIRRNK
jgi:hypothetical protein